MVYYTHIGMLRGKLSKRFTKYSTTHDILLLYSIQIYSIASHNVVLRILYVNVYAEVLLFMIYDGDLQRFRTITKDM